MLGNPQGLLHVFGATEFCRLTRSLLRPSGVGPVCREVTSGFDVAGSVCQEICVIEVSLFPAGEKVKEILLEMVS